MQHGQSDLPGEIIDVSGFSLRQVGEQLNESVFGAALREVLDLTRTESACAGFDSAFERGFDPGR
jgi:hypothetical protein